MKYQPPYGITDPNAPYINGDPTIGQQGSIPPAASIEYPQREIVNFINNSNIVPRDDDLEQLTRGVRNQWVNFCLDTGTANAMVVMLTPALDNYRQGMPLRVLVANNNTGATTININSLGARPVVRSNGSALQADDIRAGQIALLVDDGTRFQVVNFLGALSGTINNYQVDIPYVQDTSVTPNSVLGIFTPAITTVVPGDAVLVRIANSNTGPVTFTVNGLAPEPLLRNDGAPLQSRDLVINEVLLLVRNTTYWQAMRLVRSQVYLKLTTDLTLWVRTDGNDASGDGSANTAGKAFRTIQRAVNYIRESFLIAGRTVTIQLGMPGTYIGSISITNLPGSLVIYGNPAAIMSYVIQGGAAQCVAISGSGTSVHLKGICFSPTVNNHNVLECDYAADMIIENCAVSGVPTNGSAVATTSASVVMSGYFDLYSAVGSLFYCQSGSVTIGLWFTVINTHGVTFSGAGLWAVALGVIAIAASHCAMTGGAIGKRFIGQYNSVIITGAGETYLPGTINGSLDASSVYNEHTGSTLPTP